MSFGSTLTVVPPRVSRFNDGSTRHSPRTSSPPASPSPPSPPSPIGLVIGPMLLACA